MCHPVEAVDRKPGENESSVWRDRRGEDRREVRERAASAGRIK